MDNGYLVELDHNGIDWNLDGILSDGLGLDMMLFMVSGPSYQRWKVGLRPIEMMEFERGFRIWSPILLIFEWK